MEFHDLKSRHAGNRAWIVGTGPSLDAFDWSIGPDDFLIVIHRAFGVAQIAPGRTYWQVLDDAWGNGVPGPWTEWRDDIMRGNGATGLFLDPLFSGTEPGTPAPRHPNIVRFGTPMKGQRDILHWSSDVLADRGLLYTYAGSGCTALHAAAYMGAVECVFVGLDGGDGYAKCLSAWYDEPAKGGFGYVMPRDFLCEAAEILDMNVRDLAVGD